MASADYFKTKILGKTAHGSATYEGIDAILISVAIIMNLQSIVSREMNPLNPIVISVGMIESGMGFNIISSESIIEGTTRCFNSNIRKDLPIIIERMAKNTAWAFRARAEIEYNYGTSPLINNKICSKRAEELAKKLFGNECICKIDRLTISDDFLSLHQ